MCIAEDEHSAAHENLAMMYELHFLGMHVVAIASCGDSGSRKARTEKENTVRIKLVFFFKCTFTG